MERDDILVEPSKGRDEWNGAGPQSVPMVPYREGVPLDAGRLSSNLSTLQALLDRDRRRKITPRDNPIARRVISEYTPKDRDLLRKREILQGIATHFSEKAKELNNGKPLKFTLRDVKSSENVKKTLLTLIFVISIISELPFWWFSAGENIDSMEKIGIAIESTAFALFGANFMLRGELYSLISWTISWVTATLDLCSNIVLVNKDEPKEFFKMKKDPLGNLKIEIQDKKRVHGIFYKFVFWGSLLLSSVAGGLPQARSIHQWIGVGGVRTPFNIFFQGLMAVDAFVYYTLMQKDDIEESMNWDHWTRRGNAIREIYSLQRNPDLRSEAIYGTFVGFFGAHFRTFAFWKIPAVYFETVGPDIGLVDQETVGAVSSMVAWTAFGSTAIINQFTRFEGKVNTFTRSLAIGGRVYPGLITSDMLNRRMFEETSYLSRVARRARVSPIPIFYSLAASLFLANTLKAVGTEEVNENDDDQQKQQKLESEVNDETTWLTATGVFFFMMGGSRWVPAPLLRAAPTRVRRVVNFVPGFLDVEERRYYREQIRKELDTKAKQVRDHFFGELYRHNGHSVEVSQNGMMNMMKYVLSADEVVFSKDAETLSSEDQAKMQRQGDSYVAFLDRACQQVELESDDQKQSVALIATHLICERFQNLSTIIKKLEYIDHKDEARWASIYPRVMTETEKCFDEVLIPHVNKSQFVKTLSTFIDGNMGYEEFYEEMDKILDDTRELKIAQAFNTELYEDRKRFSGAREALVEAYNKELNDAYVAPAQQRLSVKERIARIFTLTSLASGASTLFAFGSSVSRSLFAELSLYDFIREKSDKKVTRGQALAAAAPTAISFGQAVGIYFKRKIESSLINYGSTWGKTIVDRFRSQPTPSVDRDAEAKASLLEEGQNADRICKAELNPHRAFGGRLDLVSREAYCTAEDIAAITAQEDQVVELDARKDILIAQLKRAIDIRSINPNNWDEVNNTRRVVYYFNTGAEARSVIDSLRELNIVTDDRPRLVTETKRGFKVFLTSDEIDYVCGEGAYANQVLGLGATK